MANPFADFGRVLNKAFSCPKCGKSTLIVGMGTGGLVQPEPVTADTHCTCPGGPVDRTQKLEAHNED